MNLTYLKLQNTTVMEYSMDDDYYKIIHEDMLPISMRGTVKDTSSNTTCVTKEIIKKNERLIKGFCSRRCLSLDRENAKKIYNALKISQADDEEAKEKITKLCKGVSVTDDYWITDNNDEKWEDINVRENPLHKTLAQISLFGKSLSITGKIRTPELTAQGCYAKAWVRKNGHLYLLKAGTKNGNEPQMEALTSKILDCTNVPHVEYVLKKTEQKIVTCCPAMTNKVFSMIPVVEISAWCQRNDMNFLDYVKTKDAEMYWKTIIVDYLCANSDRHDGNWGFYMDNRTGKILRIHPLYDHNNAFDSEFMADKTGGECQLIPNTNQKKAAHYAIKQCDFRITKPISRKIFPDDTTYFCFMERATELGLFRKRKVPFLEKITQKRPELYEATEIKKDNSIKYWISLKKMTEEKTNDKSKTQKENWARIVVPAITIPATLNVDDETWNF